jgi:hypothetical protein
MWYDYWTTRGCGPFSIVEEKKEGDRDPSFAIWNFRRKGGINSMNQSTMAWRLLRSCSESAYMRFFNHIPGAYIPRFPTHGTRYGSMRIPQR